MSSMLGLTSNRRVAVAIASCSHAVGKEDEDLRLIDALRVEGIEAVHQSWDAAGVDWSHFDLVVIRSNWDYPCRRDDFLDWAGRLRRVLNPFSIVKWNTDKRYLQELARDGLPVVRTQFIEPNENFEPPSSPFVVKPAVSCGARDTARYQAGDWAQARDHVLQLQASGRTVMIQPYLSGIEQKGEVALIYLDGEYSHSIRRSALLKHSCAPEVAASIPLEVRPYRPTSTERVLANQIMSRVPHASELLYGRVDLVPGPDGEPLVLEVELTEPSLFLNFSGDGFERLAVGISKHASSVERHEIAVRSPSE